MYLLNNKSYVSASKHPQVCAHRTGKKREHMCYLRQQLENATLIVIHGVMMASETARCSNKRRRPQSEK